MHKVAKPFKWIFAKILKKCNRQKKFEERWESKQEKGT
jgi:hypothetical protein